jgi:putative transposase
MTKISIAQFNRFVKEMIRDDKKYLNLYSQTRCEIEFRLLKAYQNLFRRIKEGSKKAGFPRFRSGYRYKSITYPQDNHATEKKARGPANVSLLSQDQPRSTIQATIGSILAGSVISGSIWCSMPR